MSPVLEERMLAAIGDATTCPHGHPIVEGVREHGVLLADVEPGADGHRPALRERGRGAPALPEGHRAAPGARRQARELGRRRGRRRLRRRAPRGLAQRRRDRLGPRRSGAGAASAAARAARALQRPLRPLTPARRSRSAAAAPSSRRSGAGGGRAPGPAGASWNSRRRHVRLVLADRGGERREAPLGQVALAHRIELPGCLRSSEPGSSRHLLVSDLLSPALRNASQRRDLAVTSLGERPSA